MVSDLCAALVQSARSFEREGGANLTASDVKASNCSGDECFARMSSAREPGEIASCGDVIAVLLTMLPMTWKVVTEILRQKDTAGTDVAFDLDRVEKRVQSQEEQNHGSGNQKSPAASDG